MSADCVEKNLPEATGTPFPTDASKIPAVTIEPVIGKIGGADNRDDAAKRTATFTVTVPAGQHLGSVVGCLGNGNVKLETKPDSGAFQSIACDGDAEQYSELVSETSDNLKAAVTYTVTVTADAASRWDVAVFSTSKPAGETQQ